MPTGWLFSIAEFRYWYLVNHYPGATMGRTLQQLVHRIRPRNLRYDLFGGLTTAILSLPMALAFGVASGAGAQAGLYGAIIVGLFAAIFGLLKLDRYITLMPYSVISGFMSGIGVLLVLTQVGSLLPSSWRSYSPSGRPSRRDYPH
jgi:MFS superfamily sulfate permease-like transporter